LFDSFVKDCNYWGIYEFDHCCEGWKKNCWIEPMVKGNWNWTYSKVLDTLKDIFYDTTTEKAIKRNPERFVYKVEQVENGKQIRLFLTLRDIRSASHADYVIIGYESKIDADNKDW